MNVKEIMTKDPVCCVPTDGLKTLATLMVEIDCGAIPIVAGPQIRRLIGIVTDRDITCRTVAIGKNPLEMTAVDVMTTNIATIPDFVSVENCVELMEEHQLRRIVVTDAHNAVVGIVSRADIARGIAELQRDVTASQFAAG